MGGKRQHNEQGLRIKKCPKCGETKDETQWNWRDKEHTVFSTYCKDCDRVRKTLAARKRYSVKENRVKENLRQKLWKRGITQEQYDKMLDKSNHACEICHSTSDLVIDHCHDTEKVRGILCWSCNVALGHFKDNLSSLKKAIKYLCQKTNL
jgi:hypothetical protein